MGLKRSFGRPIKFHEVAIWCRRTYDLRLVPRWREAIKGGLSRNFVRFEIKSEVEVKKQLKQRCLEREFTSEWSYLMKFGYRGYNGFNDEK